MLIRSGSGRAAAAQRHRRAIPAAAAGERRLLDRAMDRWTEPVQTGERRSDRSRDDQRRGGMPIDLRTSLSPDEAATRLPIHAEAVPPAAIADQALQVVPWRHPEVLVVLRRMDQLQPPQGRPLYRPINALDVLLVPPALGVRAAERPGRATSA